MGLTGVAAAAKTDSNQTPRHYSNIATQGDGPRSVPGPSPMSVSELAGYRVNSVRFILTVCDPSSTGSNFSYPTVISALIASKPGIEAPAACLGSCVAQAHCKRVNAMIIKDFFMTPPWSISAIYGDLFRLFWYNAACSRWLTDRIANSTTM